MSTKHESEGIRAQSYTDWDYINCLPCIRNKTGITCRSAETKGTTTLFTLNGSRPELYRTSVKKKKGKIVPAVAIKLRGGSGGKRQSFLKSALDGRERSALRLCRCTSRERASCSHRKGGWCGPPHEFGCFGEQKKLPPLPDCEPQPLGPSASSRVTMHITLYSVKQFSQHRCCLWLG
jgi:hypothetical protein